MPKCKKCESVFPNRIEVNGIIKHVGKRTFCLSCSPFGKHNTKNLIISNDEIKLCRRCDLTKNIKEFYVRRRGGFSAYCIECSGKQSKERSDRLKQQCIEYKGSICYCCGYNKCSNAMDFHHLNRKDKTYNISFAIKRKYTFDEIKNELDKCILVCCRCHREIESGLIKTLVA